MVTAEATAPNQWQRMCIKERMIGIGGLPVYYSAKHKPLPDCEGERVDVMPLVNDLEAECPGGSCDQPAGPTEGRLMQFMWEEQQKVDARGGYQDVIVYPWDILK